MSAPFNLFSPEGVEAELFEDWNSEQTAIGGAPAKFYKLIEGQVVNRYGEIIEKLYEDAIEITAAYEDPNVVRELSRWGLDEKIDLVVSLDMKQIKEKLGRMPKNGDQIETWDGKRFTIHNAVHTDSFSYHRHNVTLTCSISSSDGEAAPIVQDDTPFQFPK